MVVHWCGTGLSAIPGLKKLIMDGNNVIVWNRTVSKATKALAGLSATIHEFNIYALEEKLAPGDIIVSMLPGDWHVPLAKLAISAKAHFVSSSYISPEMRNLNNAALKAEVSLVNEIGLDPGIDHLMAHKLVNELKESELMNAETEVSFLSYCGGVPKNPNEFKYKFSWSPLGVLKALKSPSRSIKDFKNFEVNRPWDAISSYKTPLNNPEEFEVYPNRDSLPFIEQYEFERNWKIKQFVRGTLRLKGWAQAWANIFKEIETLNGQAGEKRLIEMSEHFWRDNAYGENDPDRVILCVDLKAEHNNQIIWHKTYKMDAWGDSRGTAMARLVSYPVSLAVKAIIDNQIEYGVSAATSKHNLVEKWLQDIAGLAQEFNIIDHVV
ncbi:saccharopine dehydrogenase NADP-binding domain-containing protein [Paracoccaceae bacterium]|nr:saccharopine dehydrogenase NADP-binding domain-containing protein [Paracoccaceae bacterium]